MKKNFYLLVFLLTTFAVNAQNVPNGCFENWTNYGAYSAPASWHTTDSIASTLSQHSVLKDSVDVWDCPDAMKMQSWTYLIATLPGAATNGVLNTSNISFEGGTPDSVRYTTLTGWYIYNPVSDTCSVTVSFTKWNGASRDIVGGGTWSTGNTVSTYAQFTVPITYALSENPDTVLIVILTGAIGASHSGTTLIIDDLNFSGLSGINNLSANSFSVNAYPNPASDFLSVEVKGNAPIKGSISILDVNGKLLQSTQMTDKKQRIDISALSNGNYLYELIDEKGTKFYSGKFSVSH